MPTPSIEDYLKTIYKLETGTAGPPVSSGAIAEAMEVAPASASNMVRRLDDLGFISYKAYAGATLTEPGRAIALEVIRHHRLLELYFKEVMGLDWDTIHHEAERLEHHISETFEDRIEEMLGHPTRDPHGHPIPTREGTVDVLSTRTLADAGEGDAVTIDHVADDDAEVLSLLEQRGLLPGRTVEVIETRPVEGLMVIKIDGNETLLGHPVANKVFVKANAS
ncbi:MAG: metal-dependent transcriptional regulator [Longimonas sp.]|uniref:metal-dependent transcriptional regulator n=1 Tax=Longimonas sp. TaxID=2039626 RepID=UPI003361356A